MDRNLRRIAAAALVLLLPLVAACSSPTPSPTPTGTAISASRCAQNRAAGAITYLTGYGFAGSPGILDVLAASQLGYFSALCLDVAVQAGTGNNTALVSAGTAQLGGFGGASDVLTADAAGAKLIGVATYGNTGLVRLLSLTKRGYADLGAFKGKLVGYHYAKPPQVEAMLAAAGVSGSAVKWVPLTGTSPLPLGTGDVDAMTGYVSSDLPILQAAGYTVTSWDPADHGIKSTFGTIAANRAFATAHPTAVQDFLRASLHAFAWLRASPAHVTTALGWAAAKQQPYSVSSERKRWDVESGLAVSSLPSGDAIGAQSIAQWTPEAQELVRYGVLKSAPDVAGDLSAGFVGAVTKDGKVVWPAP